MKLKYVSGGQGYFDPCYSIKCSNCGIQTESYTIVMATPERIDSFKEKLYDIWNRRD